MGNAKVNEPPSGIIVVLETPSFGFMMDAVVSLQI